MNFINDKLLKTFISQIIILCLVFSNIFALNSAAFNVDINESHYLENTASHYYMGLIDGFGLNSEGTCSYVAGAMLLSYYDSFLSDMFIDENYESYGSAIYDTKTQLIKKSPGILQEPRYNSTLSSTYDEYVTQYSSQYFHLELIRIARDELGIYSSGVLGAYDSEGNLKVSNGETLIEWSISIPELGSILQYYLNERFGEGVITVVCESYRNYLHTNTQEEADTIIKNKVKSLVTNGIPVVYAGFGTPSNSETYVGHALVACDRSVNDKLVFHSGWNSSTNRIISEEDSAFNYNEECYMLWLDFDDEEIQHSCSYNYVVSSERMSILGMNMCMCGFAMHPNHVHNSFKYYNETVHFSNCIWCQSFVLSNHTCNTFYEFSELQHKAACDCGYYMYLDHEISYSPSSSTLHESACESCGYSIYENHTLDYLQYTSTKHEVICESCNYDVYSNHSFNYLPYSSLQHKAVCDFCGLQKNEAHVISVSGVSNVKSCLKCGATVNTGGMQIESVANVKYITPHGSYIRADGIIVLTEYDTQQYLSGELDIDNLVYSHGETI